MMIRLGLNLILSLPGVLVPLPQLFTTHTHTHHICVQRTSNSLELTAYKLFLLLYMVVRQDDSSKKTPPWFKDEKPAQVLR